jgi:predicted dehydrogenase
MAPSLKIGLVGLDTSHAVAYSQLLNLDENKDLFPGVQLAVAFPGGNPEWGMSWDRVDGFTARLGDEFGVTIVDSAEQVAQQSDLVFITAVDGRQHLELYEQIAPSGRPVFIDKPFTTSVEDAQLILRRSREVGAPVMSCSSLRYAEAFTAAVGDDSLGPIVGIDVFGPMAIQEALPGFFWYGCHGVEMAVAAMGAGCRHVQVLSRADADVLSMAWEDGRVATYRGLRNAHAQFGATIHREKGFQAVDISSASKPYYHSLLEAILESLPQGRSDISEAEMLEVVRLMVEGNALRAGSGARTLEPLDLA